MVPKLSIQSIIFSFPPYLDFFQNFKLWIFYLNPNLKIFGGTKKKNVEFYIFLETIKIVRHVYNFTSICCTSNATYINYFTIFL